jgi:hypothetical protein
VLHRKNKIGSPQNCTAYTPKPRLSLLEESAKDGHKKKTEGF